MSSRKAHLAILDVGHGNSAVLLDEDHVVVIDTGLKNGLMDYLAEQEIHKIDAVLLSHADADHIGGLIGLLSSGEFEIGEIRVNPDSRKDSKTWDDLAYELNRLNKTRKVSFESSLTINDTGQFDGPTVQVEILAPDLYLSTKGVGSSTRDGHKIETNTNSVVIRLCSNGDPVVLLPGDVDGVGLDYMIAEGVDARAPILVFPHHGGKAGYSVSMDVFVKRLCDVIQPRQVIFSIDRNRSNLQPEVIDAVRKDVGNVRIACTQLSKHCAISEPNQDPGHLNDVFAVGRERRRCCAGSIIVFFDQQNQITPDEAGHLSFIEEFAPSALCCRKIR